MNSLDRAAHVLAVQSGEAGDIGDAARQDLWRQRVIEVLDTLRNHDENMMEAGAEIVRNVQQGQSEDAYLNDAANTWRFMIDAKLATR